MLIEFLGMSHKGAKYCKAMDLVTQTIFENSC